MLGFLNITIGKINAKKKPSTSQKLTNQSLRYFPGKQKSHKIIKINQNKEMSTLIISLIFLTFLFLLLMWKQFDFFFFSIEQHSHLSYQENPRQTENRFART